MEGMRQAWVREAPPAYLPPAAGPPRGGPSGAVTAGFGYRIAAFLFDAGLALAALAAAMIAGLPELLVGIVTWIFVTSVASAVFDGQTLGKRLTGTRVVSGSGVPIGFGTSLLRDSLARLLYLVPLFFLVDSIFAAASDDGQSLRDKMVGTYVVRDAPAPGRAWAVALASAALFACWIAGTETVDSRPGEGFTSLDRSAFVDGCRDEGSSRSRCECLYEFISSRLTHDEYTGVSSDDPDDWPAHVRQVTVDAATTCDGGEPEGPPPGSQSASARPRNLATS